MAYEFDVEWSPDDGHWAAAVPVDEAGAYDPEAREQRGAVTVAIGFGGTAWDAVGAALEAVPQTLEWLAQIRERTRARRAGELDCGRCGQRMPPVPPDSPGFGLYACDGCLLAQLSADGDDLDETH